MAQRKSDNQKFKFRPGPVFWAAVVFVVQAVLSATLYFKYSSMPSLVALEFTGAQAGNSVRLTVPEPVEFNGGKEIMVTVPYVRGLFSSQSFLITPDDCLTRAIINGVEQKNPSLPYCNYQSPIRLDLSSELKIGINVLRFYVDNKGGRGAFAIRGLPSEALVNLLLGIWIVSLGAMAALLSASRLRSLIQSFVPARRRTSRSRR